MESSIPILGLYESRRLSSRGHETIDVAKATTFGSLLIFLGAITFHVRLVTPLFLVIFWASTLIATAAVRCLMRLALASIRTRGRNLRYVVIVGTNSRALSIAQMLESRRELGYRIAGFVDDEWDGLRTLKKHGYQLVSDLTGLRQFLRTQVVDEVLIALPFSSMHEQASQAAAVCDEQGIAVRVLANIFDWNRPYYGSEDIGGNALITHSVTAMEGWPVFVKRASDIVISVVALVILAPVLLAAVLLIKLTSPGPVFFTQRRLGFNKRPFNVLKLRTMVVDAEARLRDIEHHNQVSGPVFKMWDDPRVTRIGRLLRKASIDELPQLLNVLKGEMSLVGPRPLPLRDCEGLREDWQRRRFSVKPGITCLWQVAGRSSIPFHKWMELDLQYIERWSLLLDLKILIRTIPAVMRGTGAA